MDDYDNWIQIGITVAGIIGGLIGGHKLTIASERRKEKENLDKIRYLLNADFTLIKRQTDNGIEKEKETLETLVNKNGILYYVKTLEIFSEHLHKFGSTVGGFTYWDSITNSGNLVKLEPDELRIITTTHRLVTSIVTQHKEIFDKFSLDVLNSMFGTTTTLEQRTEIFKYKYKLHFKLLMKGYDLIQKHMFNVKENISWVDLETEPILEFKHQHTNDIKISKPIVTKEGITIYPDGTKVDRKGTIL